MLKKHMDKVIETPRKTNKKLHKDIHYREKHKAPEISHRTNRQTDADKLRHIAT